MRLKKLVAAICFVCITLSACTFKDIKNEQAYLDLQEEKIITVYDNIVYYNNDNNIKVISIPYYEKLTIEYLKKLLYLN